MALIADGLLIAAALAAAAYCHVLAGRLRRLRNMDEGVGAAIAALSAQVDEMRAALKAARSASGEATRTLGETTARAEMAAGRMELLLAAIHDRDGARPVDVEARRAGARARAEAARAASAEAPLPTEERSADVEHAPELAPRPAADVAPLEPERPADEGAATVAEEIAAPAPDLGGDVGPAAAAAAGGRGVSDPAALRAALEALAREADR